MMNHRSAIPAVAYRMTKWLAACGFLLMASSQSAAQNVAIVSDLSGQVSGPARVAMLTELAANTRLQLAEKARLVIIYLGSGDEYTFTGPAQLQILATEPQTLSGAAPQKKSGQAGRSLVPSIKPSGVRQAAFVSRSINPIPRVRLLSPVATRTLDASPTFQWEASFEPATVYRFELREGGGRPIYVEDTRSNSLTLPANVSLFPGPLYTWEVVTRSADDQRVAALGNFSVAAPELRSEALERRPAPGASVSDRVAYATWLIQVELRDAARPVWRALAAERPDEPLIKERAGE